MWEMLGDKVFPTRNTMGKRKDLAGKKSSVMYGSCWDSNRNKSNVNSHCLTNQSNLNANRINGTKELASI